MAKHHWRKDHRYPGFDYSSAGSYFVTICLYTRTPLFGTATPNGVISPTTAGDMIGDTWIDLPNKFPGTALDEYVVMPEHIHGILHIGTDPDIGESPTLGDVIKWFKTMTTNRYIRGVKEHNWPGFDKYFWQRNYYDRILRNEGELDSRREYIASNPARWWESRNP